MAGSVLGLVVLPAAPAQAKPDLITERPGAIEAMSTAIAQDQRVEDLSARTSSSATFANPDGTWTVESYSGLVRSRVDEDTWVEIDPTLQDASGVLEPAAVPFDVAYSNGGDKDLATVHKADETALQIGWPTKLSDGEAEGDAVTYAGAAQGDDLVVTSRPDGFNFSVVMDAAPAADAAQVTYRVPISVGDGRLVTRADGSAEIRKGGEIQAALTPPVMWDSAEPAEGEEVSRVPVAAHFEGEGVDQTLVLEPDMEFLQDPNTVYPVTVDPTLVLTATGDTWVQSLLNGTSQDTSPELQVGSNNAGLNKYRSYANFDLAALLAKPGAVVSAASFEFSNFATGSCAGTAIRVSRVTSAWSVPGLTWNTQPTTTTAGDATSNVSYGASGCATETTVSFDATTIVSDWQGGASNHGIQIKADNEGANTGYRKYRSLENGDSAKAPKLTITYNTPPDAPTNVTVSPAATVDGTFYTGSTKPTLATAVTDPDGGNVAAELKVTQGGSTVASWTSGSVASGTNVSRTLTSDLAQGTYAAAWRVSDGTSTSAWSANQQFVVDTTAPASPSMSCTNYANNTWYETRPAAQTTCTITQSSDTHGVTVWDGDEWLAFPPAQNNQTSLTLNVPLDATFGFTITAMDVAGNASSAASHAFGVGDGGFTTPQTGAKTTGTIVVNAGAPADATAAVLNWRPVGETTWVEAAEITKGGAAWTGSVDNSAAFSRTGDLAWNSWIDGVEAPSSVELQACFKYSGQADKCGKPRIINLVEHAFGGSYPTADVGPASVALHTGEYMVSAVDVSVPGYRDTLSIGRTFQSLAAPVTASEQVFGPGWIANLQGPSYGFAAGQVVDTTAIDGSIQLVAPWGYASVYKLGGPAAQAVGVYVGQGEAAGNNAQLEIKAGTPKTLEFTEANGTVTIWANVMGTAQWNVQSVKEPSAAPATTFSYNGAYVTGIYSAPPGITCNAATQDRGCRALMLTYNGSGSATRLTQVDLRTWDPKLGTDGAPTAAEGMVSVPVAKYSYDVANRLVSAWDPRLDYSSGSHVAVGYDYTTVGGKPLLTKITPPAEKAWNLTVNTGTGDFEGATREQDLAVGGTATWAVKYNVPISGTGVPNLTADAAKIWGQKVMPAQAAAVFGPDAPATTDYTYAGLTYSTAAGVVTNTASYGAGDWQIGSVEYDPMENLVWSQAPANRAEGLSKGYNAAIMRVWLGSTNTYSTDGMRLEESRSPINYLVKDNGSGTNGIVTTRYVYDDEATAAETPGRPASWTSGTFPKPNVLVKVTTLTTDTWGGTDADAKTVWYRYQPVVAGDGDGWRLGRPTRVSTTLGTGWSTTLTRFDSEGKVVETRSPQGIDAVDGAGSDARSRITRYYTADGSSPLATCRNKPEWADAVCSSGPAGGSAAVTVTEGFNYLGGATRVVEHAGSTQRVLIVTSDVAGRPTRTSLTSVNAPAGQQAAPDATISYDDATGQAVSTTSNGRTATSTVDAWGRLLTQTDGNGNTATTTYNAAGRVATFDDGKGTYSYTWDGADANGNTERRGLLTKLDVGLSSGPDEFRVAYNANGAESKLIYPNGVTRTLTYDRHGIEFTRAYKTSNGADLTAWTNYRDRAGRVRVNVTVGGHLAYNYDDRGRLTKVSDTFWGQCTTRQYAFSLDSNRTSQATSGPAADGTCQTANPVSVESSTFDGDDKITDTGYIYDTLGRTTTLPAADTTNPADGDVTVNYYANDLVRSLTRAGAVGGAQTKTWTLDALGRLAGMSSAVSSVELRKTANHYGDVGDAPAWTEESARPDASTAWTTVWSRNVLGPNGELGIIQASNGTSRIQLTNPHGDIVATVNNMTGTAGLENYSEPSEVGLAKPHFGELASPYGWLGGGLRSADALGDLVLMGIRLYSPLTGRFLSRDSVVGGNDNAYTYPADPVNQFDTTGESCRSGQFQPTEMDQGSAFVTIPDSYCYDGSSTVHDYCTIVSEYYAGRVRMFGPCAYHDMCLQHGWGAYRSDCDGMLRLYMKRNCDVYFRYNSSFKYYPKSGGGGTYFWATRNKCFQYADKVHDGVSTQRSYTRGPWDCLYVSEGLQIKCRGGAGWVYNV